MSSTRADEQGLPTRKRKSFGELDCPTASKPRRRNGPRSRSESSSDSVCFAKPSTASTPCGTICSRRRSSRSVANKGCSQKIRHRERRATQLRGHGGATADARQEEAQHICDQKANETVDAETSYENVIEKADALERHVKTMTMRAEPLTMTEDDFFKTLLQRHDEAQDHLSALAAGLRTFDPFVVTAPKAARSNGMPR